MAKTVVALEATMNASGAENSVKSLRAQLKEAQADVAAMSDKFGETSTQAANAARKAAELKDKIGDAKALTDAFSPDKKFQAFSQALTGVAGGFAAVQGAMGLLGVQSDSVEKTLLKVQSALALTQGLSAITEAQDAFKNLGTVAVTTFKNIRDAIGGTGFGLLVVTIGIAVTALIEYANSTDEATLAAEKQKKAEEDLKKSIDQTNDSIKERNSLNEYELQLSLSNAKAKGASIKELRKIETDYWYQRRLDAQTDLEDAIKQVDDLKAQGYAKGKLLEDANKQLEQRRKDYYDINQKYNLADAKQREEDFTKKSELDTKIEEKRKERLAKEKAAAEQRVADEIDRLERQAQADANYQAQLDKDSEDALTAEIDRMERQAAADQKYKDDEVARAKAAQEAKREINNLELEAGQQLVSLLAGLGEKNKALQKATLIASGALSIAQIINNTNVGSSKEVATKGILGLSTSAILYAKAAISIASVIAATAKGLSALGSSGSVSGGQTGSGGGTTAPVQPGVNTTTLNQGQVNQLANATARAFVLESDISGNQERIQRLNRAARIN
jgi:hypothetical protein